MHIRSSLTIIRSFPTPTKAQLKVIKFDLDNEIRNKIVNLLKDWRTIANNKCDEATGKDLGSDFNWVSFAAIGFIQTLTNDRNLSRSARIFICQDTAFQQIQAMALVEGDKEYLGVKWLISHPWNIRSAINDKEIMRVKGAAGEIIRHLQATSQEIGLNSYSQSIGFYKKMGFNLCNEALSNRMCWSAFSSGYRL